MKPNTPFAFLKNNLLPPAGAALEQYYLPILETETVAVYRYLLASYDQGEKQFTCSNPQSLEYRISTVATRL